jgi:SAM-dependent methyltransferase
MSERQQIQDAVQEKYGAIAKARGAVGCCGPAPCGCGDPITTNLYSDEETGSLPDTAVAVSLGCGNPTALAALEPGQTVLDLGSGGGIDVLLSARRVGPTGKVYGLDLTDEMLALAHENQQKAGATNVEFLKGHIEALPLPADSVDVVISNCVINLAADKPAVLREIARVLRPGGRIGITDIVAEDHLTPDERAERGSYAGCIAGALSMSEFRQGLHDVGLTDVSITPSHAVAEGMVSAIVKAQKPADARPFVDFSTPRDVPVVATGCCGGSGCC